MTAALASRVCLGRVMHRRMRPAANGFDYPVFFLKLRLSELERLGSGMFGINRWRPLSLQFRDYGARDGSDPRLWLQQLLQQTGMASVCDGEHELHTFPRVLGFVFNPVNFWLCRDTQGQLRVLLAEVNNTFGETHLYLLSAPDHAPIGPNQPLLCRKLFHVSPFCRVEGEYHFRVCDDAAICRVAIDYHDNAGLLLKTAVWGKPLAFTAANLRRALLAHPLMTLAVVARIHWQALRLLFKRVPFVSKPVPPIETLSR